MRDEWHTIELKDVCRLVNGRAYKKAELLQSGPYPVLRVGNFFTNQSWYYSDLELDKDKYCDNGDLLYAWSASFGPRIWEGSKVIFHYHIWKVGFDEAQINKKFLYYWFDWDKVRIKTEQGAGATMIHVTKGSMEKRKLPLPPLPEQKRIVAILDEAFAGIDQAIANTEKNLANARELFESYLNSVFTQRGEGWVERAFSDICSITSKLVDPRNPEFNNMYHIGAGNIISMTGELVDLQTAKEEGLKSGKFVFDESMILYSKIRPYLVKVVRPTFSGLCSADIYPLAAKSGVMDKDFLYFVLLSKVFTDYAIAGSARAGMPKVNREHLFSYVSYFPEIDEQKYIVEKLNFVANESKRLESIYQQKLNALAELKQSLLQKAFSGELTAEAPREAEAALA